MSKNIIVSNRLPLQIVEHHGEYNFVSTSGGLATGMKSVHQHGNSLWIGWPGIEHDSIQSNQWNILKKALIQDKYIPIPLKKKEMEDFYYGLSNECLWPLFHYFIEFSKFNQKHWNSYFKVNRKFADAVIENLQPGDYVWIHDYQLLLCPGMIREVVPEVTIGFFLHIPFPSFEIFRIFPWRTELLNGMLGADLIGFHTYDYQRHFISSVKRILRLEVSYNIVDYKTRKIQVSTFPMGIDYQKFENIAIEHFEQKKEEHSEIFNLLREYKMLDQANKIILSIDRLDYTKGVLNRLEAFEELLEKYPHYIKHVHLIMLMVPSRSSVPHYKRLKRETDRTVGRINGKYALLGWTPILYFYRSMPFDHLIDLYISADIAMITPVRDGMNLVAKEYVATRVHHDGVLILSEMAGASKEFFDALLVNPFDKVDMVEKLMQAIEMPIEEQQQRMERLKKRAQRYDVTKWSNQFMDTLKETELLNHDETSIKINETIAETISSQFKNAKNRLLLLDYDGTLVGFHENPEKSVPDKELYDIFDQLCSQKNLDIAIISGRGQNFLDKHFGRYPMTLVAEHGYHQKLVNKQWKTTDVQNVEWKHHIIPIVETFTDNTPGTFIEEKENSLVWHYRKTDPELAKARVVELKTLLSSLVADELKIMDGDKIIEVVSSRVHKGVAATQLYARKVYDSVIVLGDDITDENMFADLPQEVIKIKVGTKQTLANYYFKSQIEVRPFLKRLY